MNTQGIQQNWSRGISVLTKGPYFKTYIPYNTYRLCESFTVLFLMSLKKFLLNEKNVGYSLKVDSLRGKSESSDSSVLLTSSYLQQLAFSGVWKSREHLLVFFNSDLWRYRMFNYTTTRWPKSWDWTTKLETHLSVELVNNEMTEGSFEEILLGAVFQQWVVHGVGSNLHMGKSHKMQFITKLNILIIVVDWESLCITHKHKKYTHLLIDLYSLLVLLQLSTVSSHLQQTLVGRTEEKCKVVCGSTLKSRRWNE